MDPRDTHIVKMLNLVAHYFCGDYGLVCNWDIAGACRHHRDRSPTDFLMIPMEDNRPGWVPIFCSAQFLFYRGKLFSVGARSQDVAAMFCESRENLRHLRGTLPFRKYHF